MWELFATLLEGIGVEFTTENMKLQLETFSFVIPKYFHFLDHMFTANASEQDQMHWRMFIKSGFNSKIYEKCEDLEVNIQLYSYKFFEMVKENF